MELINFFWNWDAVNDPNDFSASDPPDNVGKVFDGIPSDRFRYVDDQTLFFWRCHFCGFEDQTNC
jgi:hypothetical protein